MYAGKDGLKGGKDAMWEKVGDAGEAKKDMNANVILRRMGGGITMADKGGGQPDTPKKIGYKKMEPTIKDAGSSLSKKPKGEFEGAYAGELGGSAKGGKEKMSPMAQKVGAPRKGR